MVKIKEEIETTHKLRGHIFEFIYEENSGHWVKKEATS